MAGKNQVTLTFAGDSTKLEKTFDSVGASARKMDTEVGAASRNVGGSLDTVGESADGAEGKAQGFSDTLTGTKDVMGGVGEIAKGNLFEGFVMAGQGAADLAGGIASFVIPSLKNFTKASLGNATQMVRTTAVAGAQKTAMIAGAVATKTVTTAQWALNAAMRANPIGLVITALTLLVGGFILAYKKSETFRAIVNGALGGVKVAMGAVVTAGGKVWDFFRYIGPKIGGALKGVAAIITAPFRAGFNAVRSAWNNTIGGKGFSVPGWVPEIGGKGFSIPYFHSGGIVPGGLGSETLAMVRAGERITAGSNSGDGSTITIRADGQFAKTMLQMLKGQIRVEGGAKVVFEL